MASEAVKIELTNNDGFPRRFAVESGAGITKGAFLTLTDPRTASTASIADTACAGIASMDKEYNDYSTSITAWTDGIFEVYASNAVVIGAPLSLGVVAADTRTVNHVKVASAASISSGAKIIGYALEAAAAWEKFTMRLRL